MRVKNPVAYLSLASVLVVLMSVSVPAQAGTLSGQVSSNEEGQMEGVLVSAKKDGSTITTTVVSNDKGQFSFPDGKLEPGHYTLAIRAAGYSLTGPKAVDVGADGSATADIKLGKAKNILGQLSNAEWLASVPGDDKIKSFLPDCVGCHTLQRVFTSLHTPDEWKNVFTRMGRYAPESVPARPQLIVSGGARSERPRVPAAMMDQAAEFLNSVSMTNPDREEFTLPDAAASEGPRHARDHHRIRSAAQGSAAARRA